MNKQRKTSNILNVFQYDEATGIIGLNGVPVSGYALYLHTNLNDGSVGLDSSASINALYLLKNGTKQFEISYDTTGSAKIFRLLPYQSGSIFEIGNPSNAGTDYVFLSENTYGNVLIGPGIANGQTNLTGATAATHKIQFNGAVFGNSSIQASSFIKTGGTSGQFLKADGSIDGNQYYLNSNPSGFITSSALSSYLPLIGGTLTGTLYGTSISLSGNILVSGFGTFAGGFFTDLSATSVGFTKDGSNRLAFRVGNVDGVMTLSSTGVLTASSFVKSGGTSSQFLKADGSVDSNTYLTGNQTITLSGDATGSGTTGITVTLANSGVTAGTYGNASNIPTITVDSKGRITSISTTGVQIVTTLAGLSDVALATLSNAQLLQYNSTSGKWVNWTPNYATTSYVDTAVANLIASAPAALDTLNELAAALGNDANFATTTATSLGNRLRIDIGTQSLTSTQQGYGRTNLGLGSLATLSSIGDSYITALAWSKLTGVPTTIAGYGITDAYTQTQIGNFFGGTTAITGYNKSNWDTAYGWGNHASGGYLTTSSAASTYVSLSGSYSNPAWITGLAWSKITGAPSFLTSYTETDPYRVTAVAVSGTSTKTITLTRADASTVTTTWTDYDTDTNTYVTSAAFSGGTLTLTRNDTGTVAVSLDGRYYLASNPSGYISSYTETDTLNSVTGRGAITSNTIQIGKLGIGRAAAANESISVENPEGTWLIQGFRSGTSVGGLHTNSGILYVQAADVRIQASSTATWNGDLLATRPWVTSQGYITGYSETDTLASVTARGATTNSSVRFGTYADVSPTGSAFRFYDGSTFRGGFGLDSWGHGGSDANLVLYVNGDNTLFFSTSGTKRASLSSSAFNSLVALQQSGNQVLHAGNYNSYALPLSGGVMTGSLVNNTDGAVLMESNASENNNWLFKENAKAWGLFWFNRGSQSGQTVGGYTTVGAELMFMGEGTGINMPSGWTGYYSTSKIAAMISNVNGYIYSASTVYAATSMIVNGNIVLHAGNYTSYTDSRYSRKDTTGQWIKPYYEYSSYIGTDAPSTYVNQMGGGGLRVDFQNPGATGSWSHTLTWSGYNRYSMAQLGTNYYTTDARLYYRQTYNHDDSWAAWKEVALKGDPTSFGDITSTTGTLALYGGSYYGTITFGTSSYWRCGISQRDAANAEMRIWAKGGASGSIYFATGYDGESSSATLPADGMALKNNKLGIGSFTNVEFPSYKLHTKGDIYADGGWLRVSGTAGLYFESYGGGWRMTGSSYVEIYNGKSLHLQGGSVDYVGSLYFSGAGHIQPNSGSYGALQMTSGKNGWAGIRFTDYNTNLMSNSATSGIHHNDYGWQFKWESGNMYVYSGTYGGGSAYTVIHSGNIGSQSVSNATTIASVGISTIRGGISSNNVDFYVNGNANTYYPVVLTLGGQFGMHRYSISRGYSDPAPWDPIGTGVHHGGLTLTFDCSSDIAWGGNDKSWRIIQFSEQYTNMVAGMALPVTDGIIVWLRGGGAYYRFHGPSGINHGATVYYSGYTAANGSFYGTRTDLSSVDGEIRAKWPIRGYGDGDMYVSNQTVLHTGNRSSYIDTLYYSGSTRLYTGSDGTRNTGWAYHTDNGTGIHWPNNGWHIYPKDSADMYWRSGNGGASSIVLNTAGTNRGYVYANSSNEIGFLNADRNWICRMTYYGDMIMDYNYGNSIVGVYSSYRYQGVWSMGNAYKLAIDGTGTGNLYGLAWSHPNAGGQAGYLSNHGLIHMMYGTAFATISDTIWCRGDITAYSDARVKDNIEVIDNALEKVQAIRGVTYTRTDIKDTEKRHAGVIAQEVLAVLPEVITTNQDNGHYSVSYGNMVGLLVEAIKEQQGQIEVLTQKITELENK